MAVLVDGQLLQNSKDELESVLKGRLSKKERVLYKAVQLIILIHTVDHPRVDEIWPVYLWGRWVFFIIAAVWVTALASGRMTITLNP